MATREFDFVKTRVEGQARTALRITCAECGDYFDFLQTSDRRLPHEAAANKFRNHGWHVGNSPRKDACPNCQKKEKLVSKSFQSAQPEALPDQPTGGPAGIKADPPRAMSRDEGRIIFEELNEVYVSDKVGYIAGFDDDKVARKLGVPRAWVASVRDQWFGPAVSPTAVADELKKSLAKIDEAVAAERKKIDDIKAVVGRASDALARAETAIEAHVAELAKMREKVAQIGGGNG